MTTFPFRRLLLALALVGAAFAQSPPTFTNGELRIYSTTIAARDRRVCLMQDPIYRHDVTHRSMGYPHVPQVSYYLGEK